MKRTMHFRYIMYDAQLLNDRDTTYDFFQENDRDDDSVTLMTEDVAIDGCCKIACRKSNFIIINLTFIALNLPNRNPFGCFDYSEKIGNCSELRTIDA